MAILSSTDHSLNIDVRPAKEVGVFEIVVRNTGAKAIWDIQFATYDLLGPGDFGLDDTHMPASLRQEEIAQIHFVDSEGSACVVRKKWGPLSQYRGRSAGTHYVTFSPREDGATRFGMSASFTVFGADGLPFRPELVARPTGALGLSYRAGLAVSRLFRKRSPE
jgi:hypothetical protein